MATAGLHAIQRKGDAIAPPRTTLRTKLTESWWGYTALGQALPVLARETCDELRTPAARVEAARLRRAAPHPSDAAGIAAGTSDRALHLLEEACRPAHPRNATGARAAQARLEAGVVMAGHGQDIRRAPAEDKMSPNRRRKDLNISKRYENRGARGAPCGAM